MTGNLTPAWRVLTAILPAIVASAYFVVGYLVFLLRFGLHRIPRDSEIETRGQSFLVTSHARHYFIWVISPLWRLLVATNISANTVTALAALLGVAAGVAVAFGRFALGGWLFLASGILDVLDGRLARFRSRATRAGAAFDSVLDRYVDFAMLAGLGWYYRDRWVLPVVFLAMLGTSLVPYVRAKSEAFRAPVASGLMQRAERLVYLGGSVALSPILEALLFPAQRHPMHWLAVAGIVLVAVGSNITAASRLRVLLVTLDNMDAGVTPLDDHRRAKDRDRVAGPAVRH